MMMSFFKGKH